MLQRYKIVRSWELGVESFFCYMHKNFSTAVLNALGFLFATK